VQLLLAKSYLELQQHDPAIKSAENAVTIDPRNSIYHEWLGKAYGEKADHAGLVLGDIVREEDAQGIRDRSATRRQPIFRRGRR